MATIITTMSYDDLTTLIRDGEVMLNNSSILFGYNVSSLDTYFSERVGSDGYAIGFLGRLTEDTAKVLEKLDNDLLDSERVMIEVQFNRDDCVMYDPAGIDNVATALNIGLSEEEIYEQLDLSVDKFPRKGRINIICLPHIKRVGKIKVSSLMDELDFTVDDISFVRFGRKE